MRLKSDSKPTKNETTCKWFEFQRYAANYTKITSNKQCSFFEPCWLFSLRFGWHLPSYDIDDTWYKNQKNANRVVLDCNGQPKDMWKKCQPKSTCRFLNLSRDKNQIKCVPTCFGVKPNFSFKFHLHISQCNGLMLAENSKLCYSNSICSSVLFFFTRNRGQTKFLVILHYINHILKKAETKNRFRNGSNSFNLSGNEFFWCQVNLLCLQFPYFLFLLKITSCKLQHQLKLVKMFTIQGA